MGQWFILASPVENYKIADILCRRSLTKVILNRESKSAYKEHNMKIIAPVNHNELYKVQLLVFKHNDRNLLLLGVLGMEIITSNQIYWLDFMSVFMRRGRSDMKATTSLPEKRCPIQISIEKKTVK